MNGISQAPSDLALKRLHRSPKAQHRLFPRFSFSISPFLLCTTYPAVLTSRTLRMGSIVTCRRRSLTSLTESLHWLIEANVAHALLRAVSRLVSTLLSSVMKFKNKRRESLDAARTSACATFSARMACEKPCLSEVLHQHDVASAPVHLRVKNPPSIPRNPEASFPKGRLLLN